MAPICSLLFLLLLLPRPTAALSRSKPAARHRYQYHTLRATPLSPDPFAPAADAGAEASILELFPHDTGSNASSTVRLVLAHREALFAAPNATAAQLLAHRLARDAARAEAISASVPAAAARNVTRVATTGTGAAAGLAAPVVSGLALGSGEYLASVGVGTPRTPALLVLDTGSDVVWLQCAPCRRCYAQSGRVFDPRRSRSYAAVRCGAPPCRGLDARGGGGGCDRRRGTCLYRVAYGDGSVTAGDLATETLWFARGAPRVPRVAVGCGHDNQGLFVAAAGLLAPCLHCAALVDL